MLQFIPRPDYRTLLPPLLACLPTAFVSQRPPPALLPLLSPILRQRVQLLATATSSPSDSWLALLCWEPAQADKLTSIVESDRFELHPVSGEIDFGDVADIEYRRLDEETLHARLVILDLDLVVVYVLCQGDEEGGGDGWRVSEVMPLQGLGDHSSQNWWGSISEADKRLQEKLMVDVPKESSRSGLSVPTIQEPRTKELGTMGDDDDNYWAQYDGTPGRSPRLNLSAPSDVIPSGNAPRRTTSDAEYFARYGHVQPEMDGDDPSEDQKSLGESSLNGNVMMAALSHIPSNGNRRAPQLETRHNNLERYPDESEINHLTASTPSIESIAVSRLEGSAASQSHCEVAIRQHVSTSIKSLFRLTRSAGMERQEFDELVRTELDTLSLMDEDN